MSETQDFHLGQVFKGVYPPEAAYWCNDSGIYHIDEIERDPETGERRFEIVPNETPVAANAPEEPAA